MLLKVNLIFTGNYGVLVGNSGFPLCRYLLTPIINAQTPAEDRYNKAQVLTRVKVECCLGILKNRFRCLLIPLRVMGPLRSSNVISAMIVLHNIAVQNRDMFDPLPLGLVHQPGGDEDEDNSNVGGTSTRNYYVENYFS